MPQVSAQLPPFPRAQEINRLLLVLDSLSGEEGLDVAVLEEAARAYCLGAHLPDIQGTLAFLVQAGFVIQHNHRVSLAALGKAMIAANPHRTYELTSEQQLFLSTHCLFAAPYRAAAELVLTHFQVDPTLGLACNLRDLSLDLGERATVSFMRSIGVLELDGDIAIISPEHRPLGSLLLHKRAMSPEELQELLEKRRVQGEAAEHWVIDQERQRLTASACHAEAGAIAHVSKYDVCAGYDIASFDGRASTFAFDRFIEVKSTASMTPQFVLTRNELEVAKTLGKRYWLYVVYRFGLPGIQPELWKLQNPARELTKKFDLQCLEFRGTLRATNQKQQRAH